MWPCSLRPLRISLMTSKCITLLLLPCVIVFWNNHIHHPKNKHTCGCLLYVLGSRIKNTKVGIPNWDPRLWYVIYLVHLTLHAGSVTLLLNQEASHISTQCNMVFDDDSLTVALIMEGKIYITSGYIVQLISQNIALESIYLKDMWFSTELEYDHIKFLNEKP